MKLKSNKFLALLMVFVMLLGMTTNVTMAQDYDGHWAESYIIEAQERGWMSGYPDGSFRPDAPISRAEFVSMLWRALNKPEPSGISPFTDVSSDAWYYDAMVSLYEAGVVSGYGDGLFMPSNTLTREMGFTMLALAFDLVPKDVGAYMRFIDNE